MKILHVCLDSFYTEGFGYQDNILPRYHKELGNEVLIIASTEKYGENRMKAECDEGVYYDGEIKIIRRKKTTSKIKKLNMFFSKTFIIDILKNYSPDYIFWHGLGNNSIKQAIKYKKKNPQCILVQDTHVDYYNQYRPNHLAVVVKLYDRMLNKYSQKYVDKVYGVTSWRVQYAEEYFGIKKEKLGLLVMGGDDEKIHFEKQEEIKKEIRDKFNITSDDFLIVTGGKIDKTKNIHLLAEAVNNIDNEKVKLVIFGNLTDDMQVEFEKYKDSNRIKLAGWIPSDEAYNYFLASDLVVFPGTHSVLWEQACACGIPIVVKDWEGMHHVDVGGNCKFIKEDSSASIQNILEEIVSDNTIYSNMYKVAQEKGIKEFSYREIAKRSIEEVVK